MKRKLLSKTIVWKYEDRMIIHSKKKSRTSGEIDHHRANTHKNKIKAIEKALLIAKGGQIDRLKARLQFWKENK